MDCMRMVRCCVIDLLAAGLLVWSMFVSAARAEDDVDPPASDVLLDHFSIRAWGITDGLPESVVTGIAQGNDGFLWLTTANSLVRFDGARFHVVPSARLPGTGSRLLLGVLPGAGPPDAEQLFVFGAIVAELRPDGSVGNHASTGDCLRDVTIHHMVRVGRRLLAASRNQIFSWSSGSGWRRLFPVESVETISTDARVCGIDASGAVWIMDSQDTLRRFRDGHADVIELPEALRREPGQRSLNVLVSDQDGVLVVDGRKCFRGESPVDGGSAALQWTELHSLPEDIEPREHRFVEDRHGNVWLSSERGLHVLSGSTWLALENTAGTGPADVRTLFVDASGAVWVGASNGLFRFRSRLFRMLHPQRSHRPDRITAALADDGGAWWLGVAGYPLFHGTPGRIRPFDHPALARAGTPTALLRARDGTLWCGTSGQHVVRVSCHGAADGSLQAASVTRVTEAPGSAVSVRNTYGLLEDRKGRIWAATSDGVFLYCPPNAGPETLGNLIRRTMPGHFVSLSLPRVESIRSLAEATDGGVWLGAENGGPIRVAPDGKVERFSAAEGFPVCHVMGMCPDRDGGMWLATTAGLVRWDGKAFSRAGMAQGLPTESILQVISTADGRLWLGTPQGIVLAERDDVLHVMGTGYGRCACRLFTTDDGLDSDACAAGHGNLVALDARGEPCFATENGLAMVAPGLSSAPPAPLAMPSIVRVSAKPQVDVIVESLPCMARPTWPGPLDLPSGARDVRIAFTCPNLDSLDDTRFRWRLDGVDGEWSPPTTVREASYAKLPAGSFRFHVQAGSRGGEWTESAKPLALRVRPFFWETRTFTAAVALAGAAVGGGLLRLNAYRRWQARLDRERLVHSARERIARDIHDDLGTGLTEIAMAADLAQRDLGVNEPERLASRLGDIYETAARLARAVDGIVWAVNPANDTLGRFLAYLGQSAGQFLATAGLRSRVEMPEDIPDRSMDSALRHHLLLATRESLHNIVKHAGATIVVLRGVIDGERLVLTITDDGRGFESGVIDAARKDADTRDGLANMAARMDEIGGMCHIESTPGHGTRVILEAPLSAGGVP
jgi:signal transduction histidine kinase/ligand-binding sensor domain-containing protein